MVYHLELLQKKANCCYPKNLRIQTPPDFRRIDGPKIPSQSVIGLVRYNPGFGKDESLDPIQLQSRHDRSVRQDHADFKRKGADLFIERKISLVEVTLWMVLHRCCGGRDFQDLRIPKKNGKHIIYLGCGFKHFLFSTLLGEMMQFD